MVIRDYKKRLVDEKIQLYLKTFGAIIIEGPKWCEKTWTSRYNSNSEFLLADPKGNFNNKNLAILNPSLVLDGEKPRLIDEWQEAPFIWDSVRAKVDETNTKGQFILTGSATINKKRYIHTGTGRIARIKMRPMSLFESGESKGSISLSDICERKAKDVFTGEVELDKIIEYILVGGWPSTLGLSLEQGILIAREYVNSVINEDIYKVDSIKRDRHKAELLLGLYLEMRLRQLLILR